MNFKKISFERDIYKIYNVLLAIMLFSLPLSEGIKQIALWLFVVIGIVILIQEKRNIKFDILNLSLICFVVFTIISCLINSVALKTIGDPLRISLFFIILRSVRINKINLKLNLYALFGGFLITFIIGCIVKFTSDNPNYLFELKSIGHVNHSSIFILLIFIISVCIVTNKDKILQIFTIFVAIISTTGIIITASRATMYLTPVAFASILLYFVVSKKIKLKYFFISLIMLALICIIAIYTIPDSRILEKVTQGITQNETRFPIFYSAFYTWQENPFFGIGSGNFKLIDITQFFPGNSEARVAHAHNTFLTFLTENGILALASYIIFQLWLLAKFIKNIKLNIFVFCALVIVLFNNIISLVNTTFHHENALLMLFVWGIAIGLIDEKNHLFTSKS